jgi:SAM-dependent methyltransferase
VLFRQVSDTWPITRKDSPDYCIRNGYRSRRWPKYFEDTEEGITYQPDVYVEVGRLAERLGSKRIIDFGCGTATKLVKLYPQFEVVGIDYGPNIDRCREQYSVGHWIEHDLDKDEPLPLSEEQVDRAVLVASDVIEHLVHPEFFLRRVRRLLDRSDAFVISTPERELKRGTMHRGPPPNAAHVREWTTMELEAFLARCGFEQVELRLTRSDDMTKERKTILAVAYS